MNERLLHPFGLVKGYHAILTGPLPERVLDCIERRDAVPSNQPPVNEVVGSREVEEELSRRDGAGTDCSSTDVLKMPELPRRRPGIDRYRAAELHPQQICRPANRNGVLATENTVESTDRVRLQLTDALARQPSAFSNRDLGQRCQGEDPMAHHQELTISEPVQQFR